MNPSTPFSLKSYMEERRLRVDQALDQYLAPAEAWPQRLNESIRYSLFAGGKRLRPVLAIAAAEALGQSETDVMPFACALEMIHTYSLIHDDLPAMDNDDLRRGRPTNHKVYGDAVAILAGDALLSEAFRVLSESLPEKNPAQVLHVIKRLAEASGPQGMVGGQVQDLMSEKQKISLETLEHLHRHKTGKLIQISVEGGALLAGANPTQLEAFREFGACIGLSFQIADDVLDIEGGEEIGKDLGSDLEKEKATYPSLLGLAESKKLADQWTQRALRCLDIFGASAEPLREIAQYVVYRKN